MRVCDVVLNSIWYDPRVNRQIEQYLLDPDIDLSLVGFRCDRYNETEISRYTVPVDIVEIPTALNGKQHSIFKKIEREKVRNKLISEAIIKQKPDVIHANDLNALIPAMTAAEKLNAIIIYDSHEIYTENGRVAKNPVFKTYLRMVEKRNILRCDCMVCVSHAAADFFVSNYHVDEPLVITNCMPKNYLPNKPVIKHSGFEVLNHGQFYAGRGYDLMVKACDFLEDCPEVRMCIRGFGVLEDELHNEVERIKNKDHFVFYPPVDVHDLILEAAKSHVGVAITLPISVNFERSISNKIFEYIFAGLPVIMSDIPEHRYLNDLYHFGIVLEENTPECLAAAVKRLFFNEDFYRECAENSKKLIDILNWETEFGRLISLEKQLFSSRNKNNV